MFGYKNEMKWSSLDDTDSKPQFWESLMPKPPTETSTAKKAQANAGPKYVFVPLKPSAAETKATKDAKDALDASIKKLGQDFEQAISIATIAKREADAAGKISLTALAQSKSAKEAADAAGQISFQALANANNAMRVSDEANQAAQAANTAAQSAKATADATKSAFDIQTANLTASQAAAATQAAQQAAAQAAALKALSDKAAADKSAADAALASISAQANKAVADASAARTKADQTVAEAQAAAQAQAQAVVASSQAAAQAQAAIDRAAQQAAAAVAAAAQSAAENTWTPRGHWKDNDGRTLPNNIGNVTSVQECKDKAKTAGYNVIGLQFGGQCWAGKDLDYEFLGQGVGISELGDFGENNVFTAPTYVKNTKNSAAATQGAMTLCNARIDEYLGRNLYYNSRDFADCAAFDNVEYPNRILTAEQKAAAAQQAAADQAAAAAAMAAGAQQAAAERAAMAAAAQQAAAERAAQ